MIRCPRRNSVSIILCSILFVFPFSYFYFGRYLDLNRENEASTEKIINFNGNGILVTETTSNSPSNNLLDDYEFSRILLPETNRPTNAIESGNLSYDHIRRGSINRSIIQFDAEGISSSDILVFLHIQKTGGTTFERYLVRQLVVPRPCECRTGKKRCFCRRPSNGLWLFSRFSNGWPCGLHADYTELIVSGCVQRVLDRQEITKSSKSVSIISKSKSIVDQKNKTRRYFLTTFLREPLSRYYSEYRHVTQRGATWSAALHYCNGRRATNEELPPCYDPQTGWVGATLKEFLNCSSNLANNRQTRMLADLNLINCYNRSGMSDELRDSIMLKSAKVNLYRMAYFGLQEDMRRSQYIFERTFGLEFKKPLLNWNETSDLNELSLEEMEKIRSINRLDVDLYDYAKKLFKERFEELKKDDPLYDVNMAT